MLRYPIVSLRCFALALLTLCPCCAMAGDWPTYRQNSRRNAIAAEGFDPLQLGNLQLAWKWTAPEPPHPAWFGPAKWDAYAELQGLKSMRNYDNVFHVVAGGEHVYFGSTADDGVHCLYAQNGQTKWLFSTGGPVRVPPTLSEDKIYFGSDDGFAYCISADDGRLLWKFRPGPATKKLLHDGRLISPWPCRSGVAVDRGIAYFTASLLPWNEGYLCAIDAATGKVDGDQHFVKPIPHATMEAPLALSDIQIIVPRGRIAPMLYSRSDGSEVGPLKGGGGSFVVLAQDQVFHGPGNKAGWLTSSKIESRDVVATLKSAKAMVIDGPHSFLLTEQEVVCSDMAAKEVRWRAETDCNEALIKAGQTLFLGGAGKVAAYDANSGERLWEHTVGGVVYGLALAEQRLFVSTTDGSVYAFGVTTPRPQPPAAPLGDLTAESADSKSVPGAPDTEKAPSGAETTESGSIAKTEKKPAQPAADWARVGPWLQFDSPSTAHVHWQTAEPRLGIVHVQGAERIDVYEERVAKVNHRVQIQRLPHQAVFRYQISSRDQSSQRSAWIEVDTLFNFSHPRLPRESDRPGAGRVDAATLERAQHIVEQVGITPGICVVLGLSDGSLSYELIKRSGLRVIAFDDRLEVVEEARRAFLDSGIYGSRFSCHHVKRLSELAVVGDFANVVTSEVTSAVPFRRAVIREAWRVVKPGGMLTFGKAEPSDERTTQEIESMAGRAPTHSFAAGLNWMQITKPRGRQIGQWSHIYGTAGNALHDGEQLGNATKSTEFEVQWIGRPGPRFQPDRNGRKPPPLVANGRLLVQGLQRIAAVDQFNGTVLWSLEIPDLARFNIPRDCGNWCADQERVYIAIRDHCWVIDAATGKVNSHYAMPADRGPANGYDWGFVARTDEILLGSSVRKGTSWISFWGKAGWYDAERGEATHQICSDALFALNATSGQHRWRYEHGVILNSTIAASEDRVYFLECRNQDVRDRSSRRVAAAELWQQVYLVSLDARTGEVMAEQPLSVTAGQVACYLAHSDQHLVLVTSANKSYHVYAYSANACDQLWEATFPWGKGKADHGSHLSRPAIVGNKVFVRPAVLDLESGKRLPMSIPMGGCGTYAATESALFFRAGSGKNSAVWDSKTGEYTTWSRLRPDCWLSTIPAGGMLLSPEGGGGCSCGSWLETSIGFMPIQNSEGKLHSLD
jgi:outer membrane protein assembly factor BamB/2-polyprenyl-3-methyl-5-hydroxy-6-metoxy-1,4-benzoquinol methylase